MKTLKNILAFIGAMSAIGLIGALGFTGLIAVCLMVAAFFLCDPIGAGICYLWAKVDYWLDYISLD